MFHLFSTFIYQHFVNHQRLSEGRCHFYDDGSRRNFRSDGQR